MINGVLTTCANCGSDVNAVGGVVHVDKRGSLTHVFWIHRECEYQGEIVFASDYFKLTMSPAVRWWVKREGPRPLTEDERLMKLFVFDLEGIETVEDLELHWRFQRACRPKSILKERGA